MKKLMILIALVGLTGMVNAQSEKKKNGLTTDQKADKMTAKMNKSLNLTEAQVLKVKEANLNFVKERENMQTENRQKGKQLKESHKTNLQSILDRSDKLQTLSIEELNKFVIQNTKDLEASMISQIRRIETTTSLDLQQLTSDLDRTIASIDSIQEKIAELEVSTQNIQNNVNRLMS